MGVNIPQSSRATASNYKRFRFGLGYPERSNDSALTVQRQKIERRPATRRQAHHRQDQASLILNMS